MLLTFTFSLEKPKKKPIYFITDDVTNTYSSINIYAGLTHSKWHGYESEHIYNQDYAQDYTHQIRIGAEKDYGNNCIIGISFTSHGNILYGSRQIAFTSELAQGPSNNFAILYEEEESIISELK